MLDLADESAVLATRLLADLGADVILVEPPVDGSRARQLAPFLDAERGVERSFHHLYHNANKRSITLDITRPEGADLLRHLAAASDVLVETARPGAMDELGLGYGSLEARNPSLIYIAETLQRNGIAAAAVESLRDTMEVDPQLRAHYQRITQPCDPDVEVTIDREAIRFAGHEHVLERAPMLGEHIEIVLRELVGLSREDIDRLVVEGVID